MKNLHKTKTDYTKLLKYYKRKLVDYGAMRELKNEFKSEGNFQGKIKREVLSNVWDSI